jgi:hypothetical protein
MTDWHAMYKPLYGDEVLDTAVKPRYDGGWNSVWQNMEIWYDNKICHTAA